MTGWKLNHVPTSQPEATPNQEGHAPTYSYGEKANQIQSHALFGDLFPAIYRDGNPRS